MAHTDLDAETVAREAMRIAADLCIYTNHQITVESLESSADPAGGGRPVAELTPRQIVEELDKYIVGQQAAKRAVAVALRNRYRRRRLPRTCEPRSCPGTS